MKEPDKKIWKLHVNKYIDEYMPEKWKNIVPKVLKYRDPDFINAFDYQMHLTSEVFVAAFFTTAFFTGIFAIIFLLLMLISFLFLYLLQLTNLIFLGE